MAVKFNFYRWERAMRDLYPGCWIDEYSQANGKVMWAKCRHDDQIVSTWSINNEE
jgi:hypothetical protein